MPVQFCFVDNTGNAVNLDIIDDQLCQEQGIAPSESNYCNLFQLITIIGCSSKVQTRGQTDKEKLSKHLKDNFSEMSEEQHKLIIKFMAGEYTFSAWR